MGLLMPAKLYFARSWSRVWQRIMPIVGASLACFLRPFCPRGSRRRFRHNLWQMRGAGASSPRAGMISGRRACGGAQLRLCLGGSRCCRWEGPLRRQLDSSPHHRHAHDPPAQTEAVRWRWTLAEGMKKPPRLGWLLRGSTAPYRLVDLQQTLDVAELPRPNTAEVKPRGNRDSLHSASVPVHTMPARVNAI